MRKTVRGDSKALTCVEERLELPSAKVGKAKVGKLTVEDQEFSLDLMNLTEADAVGGKGETHQSRLTE